MKLNEFLSSFKSFGTLLQSFVNVLIFIAKFLFLTPWGWILIVIALVSMILVRIRTKRDEITFYSVIGGVSETLFWFYSNLTSVLIGVFVVFIISFIYTSLDGISESMTLFKDMKTLEATIKNMKAERKILEVKVTSNGKSQMTANVKYFAYSPVQEKEINTGEKNYTINGDKLFVDFGVINFKYTLIEKGEAVNIAFPYKIYSDTIAYNNGQSIMAAKDKTPLSFNLEDKDLYLLTQKQFSSEIQRIFEHATNDTKARRIGLRTSYGQSLALAPDAEKIYRFYSTATGGIIVK